MELIIYSFISGIFGGGISILFRFYELKKQTFYVGRQMLLQLGFFYLFYEVAQRYFSGYELSFSFIHLNASWIFFLINSTAYFLLKYLFETYTGISFLPAEEEIEEYIEKQDKEI